MLPGVLAAVIEASTPGLTVAHPITEAYRLPFSPVVAAGVAAAVVFAIALLWPERREPAEEGGPERPLESWEGDLSAPQWVTRIVAITLLALGIAAGRLGVEDELDNLAPALIVGAAWPLVVLAACFGPIWRWLDPWDGAVRPLDGADTAGPTDDVRLAALLVLPWVWYLSAYVDPLDPRSVGAALGFYTIVTLAGSLAAGRARWLGGAEPLGITLSWLARLPRWRLVDWNPPRGAEALLGTMTGGVLFGAVRRSELWGNLNSLPEAQALATLGVIGSCLLVMGLLYGIRWGVTLPESRPLVARGVVPAVAGIIVAVALDRNRLFTSVQLLPGLLGDPFGSGWDLLGNARTGGLNPAPLGESGLLWAQLGVLVAGFVAGGIVIARRASRRARQPVVALLAILVAISVVAIATH